MLRMSAVELFVFSGLYLLLFVFTQSWFVLGGAVSCAGIALKHRRLAQSVRSRAPVEVQAEGTVL